MRATPFALALMTLASTTCVFPEVGLGAPCEDQSACLTGDACVRIDPENDGEGNVCLPMLELPAPQECIADDDCAAAGFPIESFCDANRCTCDLEDGFTCDFEEIIGEHTCRCLAAGLETGDACEDDTQCVSFHCGNGNCVDGVDGDGCDNDEDCQESSSATCTAGTCE